MSSDEVMLLGPQTNDPQFCTLLASSFRMVNAVKKKRGVVTDFYTPGHETQQKCCRLPVENMNGIHPPSSRSRDYHR